MQLLNVLGRRFTSADSVVNNVLVVALVVLCFYFATQSPAFLSLSNINIMLTNWATTGVVAAVFALLVISGNVDLSVGSTAAMSGLFTAMSSAQWGNSFEMSMVIGVGSGVGVGVINGFLCGILRFNPIIVTLGMLGIIRGGIQIIHQRNVTGLENDAFRWLGNGSAYGVSHLLIIVLLVFLIAGGILKYTHWGRYLYAIGLNPNAAFLAGLPVRGINFILYVATGAAAGLAGVLSVARLDGASPGSLGLQLELQVLTVVLLGGIAFTGGRGRVLGVFTAWLFLAALSNGLTLLNVTPFVQLVISGLALVFAAGLDRMGTLIGPYMQERRLVAARKSAMSGGISGEGRQPPSRDGGPA